MTRRPLALLGVAASAALVLTACTGGGNANDAGTGKLNVDLSNLSSTTVPGTAAVDEITWNLPYEPLSLDPQHSFNYAENTVIANLCDSLLRMNPDLSTGPGLAASVAQPDDTTYVYTLQDGVTFWNGTPLTPADVVYSLTRQAGAGASSYYSEYFTYLESAEVTGANEVTVHLSQPDALFEQGMSSAAGAIVQQAAAEAAGESFGTPTASVQCTGPFKLDQWNAGKSIVLTKNAGYWDETLMPKVEKLTFTAIADESTAVNALRSGDVDGQFFYLPPAGLSQLESSDTVTTTYGKSFVFWTLASAATEGLFANPDVRNALLASIDRTAVADVVFQGAALPASTLAGPDYWDTQADIFEPAWQEFSTDPDPAASAKLLADAGDLSQTITIAIQGSSAVHEQTANLLQAAGAAIGLKIETKVIPVEQYGNLYFDPAARKGVDAFFTTWYGNMADPLDVYNVFATGGASNFDGYDAVSAEIETARQTIDPAERAQLTVEIQKQVTNDLPWMPLNYLPTILVQNDRISGATASVAYLSYPWAATIGGVE
ncbi:ABC transporter substrate-binding protein [Glaciibacter psychrotolerans]|uniref:Peptide/nickel transport system substrate-binding protein n=1 Tax=Glaciibacter psychrotolerans TaxID=670054 RepID=A0A7Z0J581_9MICO|nr:ABC transporter substrate-binding protein [Leifsonia psychrotolerans]NYJ18634.1 peptide/nickel transport system substrate-binding protein [Leifsonia psychrotolerans]